MAVWIKTKTWKLSGSLIRLSIYFGPIPFKECEEHIKVADSALKDAELALTGDVDFSEQSILSGDRMGACLKTSFPVNLSEREIRAKLSTEGWKKSWTRT